MSETGWQKQPPVYYSRQIMNNYAWVTSHNGTWRPPQKCFLNYANCDAQMRMVCCTFNLKSYRRTTFWAGVTRFEPLKHLWQLWQNAVCTNMQSCFAETHSIELMMKSHWKSNVTMAITYLPPIQNNITGTIFLALYLLTSSGSKNFSSQHALHGKLSFKNNSVKFWVKFQ